MAESNVAERLKSFIENENLTYSQFADRCGIPRPSLSQLLTGRNKKINDSMIRQIHNEFPFLSITWLLFGEGEMDVRNTTPINEELGENDLGLFSPLFTNDNTFAPNSSLNSTKLPAKDRSNVKISKESAPNDPLSESFVIDNQVESLKIKIKELTSIIEKMKANPRKVTQITLYYDDSTFETFERTQKPGK